MVIHYPELKYSEISVCKPDARKTLITNWPNLTIFIQIPSCMRAPELCRC